MRVLRWRNVVICIQAIAIVVLLLRTQKKFLQKTELDWKFPEEDDDMLGPKLAAQQVWLAESPGNYERPKMEVPGNDTHSCHQCKPTVHVAMMVAGVNATRSFVTVVKSILLFRTTAVQFHLMVDNASRSILSSLFDTWQVGCVTVSFHILLNHTAEVAWVRTTHASGPYGLAKLTYELVLTEVDRVIALDTDLVLQRDILELWKFFDDFSPSQMIAAVPQQSDWYLNSVSHSNDSPIWPAVGRGINSGVMLLHLERMRSTDWRSLWATLTKKQLLSLNSTSLADQDIFNLLMTTHSQLYFELPCFWNVQIHNLSSANECYSRHDVGILHWNSPLKLSSSHSRKVYFQNVYSRVVASDGASLRQPPLKCGTTDRGVFVRPNTKIPASDDPCFDLRLAGDRLYRTHINYYFRSKNKRLFSCQLSGTGVDEAMQFIRSRNMAKILADSLLLAQHRFFKFVEENRQLFLDSSIPLPEHLGAICDELDYMNDDVNGRDLTLTTQLSFDRLDALSRMLATWNGPMSVAVYLRDADLLVLDAFVQHMQALISSLPKFSLHCVFQEGEHFPVNFLRNIAVEGAKTQRTFNVDVDFVINSGAYDLITRRIASLPFLQVSSVALVIPAFETDAYSGAIPQSKADLHALYKNSTLRQFRVREWPAGHAVTDYDKWFLASQVYSVKWKEGYEPYLVVATTTQKYDTRFVGFGWNKISYIQTLADLDVEFYVLPDVFIVHTPHAPSSALTKFRTSNVYKKCIAKFLEEFQSEWKAQLLAENTKKRAEMTTTQSAFEAFLRRREARIKERALHREA